MKALTSSCSKAIVDTSRSWPPRVSIRVSDRPEFFFSPRPWNDKKGCNLWLLKVVPIKGVFPVHAVPSKDQVDLEAAEPEAENNKQTNESKFVRVAFGLQKNCEFGEQFLIVGDDPSLGSWDPLEALPMTWSEGHIWTAEVDMPAGKLIQFKFILKGKEGDIIWQPGSDRVIQTWETVNTITVCEDWEYAELQTIAEADQLAEPDKETPNDSEVSASAEILDNPHNELDSNASEVTTAEDSKFYEIPLAETVTDNSSSSLTEIRRRAIARNIIPDEEFFKDTSSKWNEKIEPSEESADLGNNGSIASLEDEEGTVVESSLLFEFVGDPVLVPGLTIPPTEPSNEASQGEEVQEKTSKDISVEASETDQDRNPPEFSKEQETNDAQNYESEDGTPLQNHMKWGQASVKKFLSQLGFH
ncbi:uncharacterized protein LOC114167424 isoform X1 [Vigna unguiculata]|uniref:uncharacterized protein LOC114167424 isoform X1 n=2 Tax=Vigna unguiculata TaxID=3917 RepID=UPI001016E6A2|nr:uncharacterized protein LOC114167424 isoform X1 [Vigna unguiculata]